MRWRSRHAGHGSTPKSFGLRYWNMSNGTPEFEDLKARVAALTQRVYTLEKQAGITPSVAAAPPQVPAAAPQPIPIRPQPPRPPAAMKKALTPDLESKIGSEWLN